MKIRIVKTVELSNEQAAALAEAACSYGFDFDGETRNRVLIHRLLEAAINERVEELAVADTGRDIDPDGNLSGCGVRFTSPACG